MTLSLRSLAIFILAIATVGCGSVWVVPEDVTGTIVDGWQTPWPGRQVLVGDTLTTTGEAGHFTVHDVPWPTSESVARTIYHFAAEHAAGVRTAYCTIRGGGHWIRVHVNHLDRRLLVLWMERAR
jgi:hypothetical protein